MSRYKEFKGWLPAAQWMLEKPGERWTRQLGGGCTWKGVNPYGENDTPGSPSTIYAAVQDEHGPIEKPVELPELDVALVSTIKNFFSHDAPIQEMFQLAIAQAVRMAKGAK